MVHAENMDLRGAVRATIDPAKMDQMTDRPTSARRRENSLRQTWGPAADVLRLAMEARPVALTVAARAVPVLVRLRPTITISSVLRPAVRLARRWISVGSVRNRE